MNIKFKNLINSFFLLLWFRLIQATLDPNFDYDQDSSNGNLIDEKFKSESYYNDLIYLNNNSTDSFQNKYATRDRPGSSSNKTSCQQIRQIPSNIRTDLKLTYFYQKYTEAYGIPVIGSNKASQNGLKRACYVLKFFLANSPELREHFYKRNLRVVVMATSENILNMPEYNTMPHAFNSLRGLSATVPFPLISVGEENVQCGINDKLKTEDLLLHSISFSLVTMNALSASQKSQLESIYNRAKQSFKGKETFMLSDPKEYLAKSIDLYLGANGKKENIQEDIKDLDPAIVNLIQQIFICNNVYINKCKTTRETQVLKVGKNCEPEMHGLQDTTKASMIINELVENLFNTESRQTVNYQKPTINTFSPLKSSQSSTVSIKTNFQLDQVKPSNSDCNDINQNCELWSQKGECQRNKQFMSIECKLSCNLCKKTSIKTTLKVKSTTQTDLSVYVSLCKDEFAHCPVFALRGDCKTNPHHMLDKCKRSCNLCGDLVEQKDRIQLTSKKSAIRRPISEPQLPTTKSTFVSTTTIKTATTPLNLAPKSCMDLAPHCNDLAARGDCSTNKDTMFHYCPLSCKFC